MKASVESIATPSEYLIPSWRATSMTQSVWSIVWITFRSMQATAKESWFMKPMAECCLIAFALLGSSDGKIVEIATRILSSRASRREPPPCSSS